ncbi:MAG: dual-specificity RNA methyltransferase RlmN [Nitrospinaceae bacterium]|nr:MAG: dual-specificity RNA methyltransferase RlmN [Nitrospinaceae bacterium]
MENLIGTSEKKLLDCFAQWQEKPYRAHQVFTWLYHRGVRNFDLMTNLSKDLRKRLSESFHMSLPRLLKKIISEDGTLKYLFELEDGSTIESVWMPSGQRKTLCISTQVGCRLACSFCKTATLGLKRNLTAGEIIGQFMKVNEDLPEEDRTTNVVIMGMGEPLDNYQPLVDALRLMVSPQAMKISTRKITLSTSGLVDKIKAFQDEDIHVNLAISLNATLDEVRNQIMPINKKYPIETLMDTLRSYPLKPTRKLTFEYVLLAGINDTDEDAKRLARLLHGIPSKINLIPFNHYEPSDYHPPSEERILSFQNYLLSKHYSVFIRKNRGTDILGACGQLAAQPVSCATSSK